MREPQKICARWIAILLIAVVTKACAPPPEGFSFDIDPRLTPHFNPPVAGQPPPAPVAVVRDPQGHTNMFAADEVVLRPRDDTELKAFLAKYGGTVLVDGSPRAAPKPGKPAPPSGAYLIHVETQRSNPDDLGTSMERAHLTGRYTFSSLDGARLVALAAREHPALSVSLDPAFHPDEVINETNVIEGQLDGKPFNYAAQPYTTATRNLRNGQLGIGVVRAWDYLWYKGIPFGKVWHRPPLAIIDGGFALDTTTGAPLNGNLDFEEGRTPVQLNEDLAGGQRGHNAGGTNPGRCSASDPCPWHGTGVFSVAAAVPRNQFGSAGTSGGLVKPYLIRVNVALAFRVAQAITDAVLLRPPADVINLSFAVPCGEFCSVFYDFEPLVQAIDFARGYNNAVVVAAAGNDGEQNNNRLDTIPCTLDGVLCVGAIDFTANHRSYSGRGSRVSIWAPDCIPTTPDPSSNGQINPEFCGTSASAPFVAGIVSLMKALNPDLDYDTTRRILQSTALPSPDPVVTPGYINALGAVMAVSPNQPPTIAITSPPPGANVPFGGTVTLMSSVSDPEQDPNVDGVTVAWTSNVDGALCMGIVCDSKPLSFGPHTITATVTDPFGKQASAQINIQAVSSGPPTAWIPYPSNGQVFYTSQQINLRGFGSSPYQPGNLPDPQLAWASNVTGALGKNHDIWVTLPAGTHNITLTATDVRGQTGHASVNIDVQASADVPTVKITAPSDFSSYPPNSVITFTGTGSDPVDGPLTGASLTWSSDVDGALGPPNTQISVTLSGIAGFETLHHITLNGVNKAGKKATHTISVYVGSIS